MPFFLLSLILKQRPSCLSCMAVWVWISEDSRVIPKVVRLHAVEAQTIQHFHSQTGSSAGGWEVSCLAHS